MYRKTSMVVAVLLSLVLSMTMVAAAKNDTLIIGTGAEAVGLDLRLETDVPSFERINVIMEPLLKFDVDMQLTPLLAKSWEVSDDTMTISF